VSQVQAVQPLTHVVLVRLGRHPLLENLRLDCAERIDRQLVLKDRPSAISARGLPAQLVLVGHQLLRLFVPLQRQRLRDKRSGLLGSFAAFGCAFICPALRAQ
jgi:hypothetical protein